MTLRRLSDGARHALYIAGDRIGYLVQCGHLVEAYNKRGRELGRFGEAEAAIKAVISSAAGPKGLSHTSMRAAGR
jgi:hypothetical protein